MPGYDNPITATLRGLYELVGAPSQGPGLADDERIDGLTCLVTGANSGLGKASAIGLARRGARVIMACRGGIPDAGDDVKRASGSDAVEMMPVDLRDLSSVNRLCDQLRDRGVKLDLLVQNAAVVPGKSSRTGDGYELMFQVNYLAAFLLIERLLRDGVIPNRLRARNAKPAAGDDAPGSARARPRIVIVSSEAHRSGALDPRTLGDYVDYGVMASMKQYAHTKLALCTLASELSRRLSDDKGADVSVHSLCPGPLDSNVARDAPAFVKPILKPLMRRFFKSPEVAAWPVLYLACARAIEGQTGIYMHRMVRKEPSPSARDAALGARAFEASEALLRRARA